MWRRFCGGKCELTFTKLDFFKYIVSADLPSHPLFPAGRVRFKGGLEALAGPWLAKPGCLGIVGGCCFLAKALSLGCRGCGWCKDQTCEWVHPALPPHSAVQKSPTPPSISQTFQWEQGWAAGCTHRAGHRGDWTTMWEMQGKHTGAVKEGHV